MKKDERREAIKSQREQLIHELETLYMAAFDRLGQLEGDIGEVKAAQFTQIILNSNWQRSNPCGKRLKIL